MKSIVVRIQEDDKALDLIRFLKDINYIDVEVQEQEQSYPDHDSSVQGLAELYGLWQGRDINLSKLREKAWKSRGVKE